MSFNERKLAALAARIEPDFNSRILPLDMRVLVLPDPTETKTAGGIIKADVTLEKEKYAGTKATLVAIGDNAFMEWGDAARKPKVGDRVHFAQYSGSWIKGEDGREFIVMNDKDLTSIVEVGDV